MPCCCRACPERRERLGVRFTCSRAVSSRASCTRAQAHGSIEELLQRARRAGLASCGRARPSLGRRRRPPHTSSHSSSSSTTSRLASRRRGTQRRPSTMATPLRRSKRARTTPKSLSSSLDLTRSTPDADPAADSDSSLEVVSAYKKPAKRVRMAEAQLGASAKKQKQGLAGAPEEDGEMDPDEAFARRLQDEEDQAAHEDQVRGALPVSRLGAARMRALEGALLPHQLGSGPLPAQCRPPAAQPRTDELVLPRPQAMPGPSTFARRSTRKRRSSASSSLLVVSSSPAAAAAQRFQDPDDPLVVLAGCREALLGRKGVCGGCGAGVSVEREPVRLCGLPLMQRDEHPARRAARCCRRPARLTLRTSRSPSSPRPRRSRPSSTRPRPPARPARARSASGAGSRSATTTPRAGRRASAAPSGAPSPSSRCVSLARSVAAGPPPLLEAVPLTLHDALAAPLRP